MSILITGGCGLIGVGLTRGLLEEGKEPVLFDIAPEDRLPKDLGGRIKYFRGIRFPQVIGPGVRSGGFGQYNPGMIEAAALGKPYEVWVPEETALPIIYIKDAVRSLLQLYDADESRIKTRIYNLGQITPPPTAKGLADIVRRFVPGAKITFKPDPSAIEAVRVISKRIDGTNAEKEWDWKIGYSAEETVKDFLEEMKLRQRQL